MTKNKIQNSLLIRNTCLYFLTLQVCHKNIRICNGVVMTKLYWITNKNSFVSVTYTWLIGLSFVELTTLFVNVVIVVAHLSVEAAQIHDSTRMAGNINLLAFRYLLFHVDRVDVHSVTALNYTSLRFMDEWTISFSCSSQRYCLMTSHLVSALLVVICLRAACKLYISLLVTESFIKSYFSL